MGAAKNAWINQMLGASTSIVTCKFCKKKYKQITQDQTPGFRDMEFDICPYCKEVNGKSMSEEYYNSKMD